MVKGLRNGAQNLPVDITQAREEMRNRGNSCGIVFTLSFYCRTRQNARYCLHVHLDAKCEKLVDFVALYDIALSLVSDRSDTFLHQASYMVDIEAHLPTAFDPFAEAKESGAPGAKEYVHIRIQQRNGKKSLTTVQGLRKEYSYDKILKDLKKEFCCNGNVVQDKELGKVIQLQGDQRKNVSQFLVSAGLVKKDQIKIHGF
nr:protein translation factor SUI1 homolog [Ipomoea batatas]